MLYAASLWLSNSAYLYLSVSFIQMTKSLMPGLVYATGIALGTERFTRANAGIMLLIASGVIVCAVGEVNLVFTGVAQQLTALLFEVPHTSHSSSMTVHGASSSSCFGSRGMSDPFPIEKFVCCPGQAARLTLVQLLINSKGLQMNPLQSLYYVSPACFICLAVPFSAISPQIAVYAAAQERKTRTVTLPIKRCSDLALQPCWRWGR